MTAMDEELDPTHDRKPAATMAFTLKTTCPLPADPTITAQGAQDDEQKTTSTPQISEASPRNWRPFPQQLIQAENDNERAHSDQESMPDGQEVLSLELYEGEVRLSNDSVTPTRRQGVSML